MEYEYLYENEEYVVYLTEEIGEVLPSGEPLNYCVESKRTGRVEFVGSNLPQSITVAKQLSKFLVEVLKEDSDSDTQPEVTLSVDAKSTVTH